MDDAYENIDHYNPKRKTKTLIMFDDLIADIMANKKFQAIIKELFTRCRKLNILLVFITQCYFSVPKHVRLNSTLYLIIKINTKRESENIARSPSADVDYKDFVKICRECTKESFSFSTNDTTLPPKMTLTNQIKTLNDKIKANQAQYDLRRDAAKISALPSKDLLANYEYLTGEDLGHKPSVFEKAKFEYSPLRMLLSKAF